MNNIPYSLKTLDCENLKGISVIHMILDVCIEDSYKLLIFRFVLADCGPEDHVDLSVGHMLDDYDNPVQYPAV